MGKIVVGVDGSQAASAALEWAITEARIRNAELDIVVSWDYPALVASEPIFIPIPDESVLQASAEQTADTMIVNAGLAGSDITYRVFTPEGRAGETLVGMAGDADLLVVGSHGSNAFKELFFGSISNYCAHHSPCPVVLVRPAT